MSVFYTSDLHMGHRNVLLYCNRPWWYSKRNPPTDADVQAMNIGLIERWNSVVGPADTTYLLGDFAMGNKTLWPEYRKKLNGRIVLIRGNHDRNAEYMKTVVGIDEVHDELDVEVNGYKVRMRHYPLGLHDGDVPEEFGNHDYLFCGHIHERWRNRGSEINVGVDAWDWYPRTFEELTRDIPPGIKPDLKWERHHHTGDNGRAL